jgi:hypothetical protein
MEKLTGHVRYRASLFGRLILQVEVSYYDDMPHGGTDRLKWRDAKITDLALIATTKQQGGKQ